MLRRRIFILLAAPAALLLLAILAGCSTQGVQPDQTPPRDILGDYESTQSVGPLGLLSLHIEWNQTAHRYKAVLASLDTGGFGENTGFGTYGGTHLVLNFFSARNSEHFYYYFLQAQVEPADGAVTSITGTLVFPDQQEELEVTFIPQ